MSANETISGRERIAALVLTAAFLVMVTVPTAYHLLYGLDRADLRRWAQWLRSEQSPQALRKIETDFDHKFLPARVARALAAGAGTKQFRLVPAPSRIGVDGFLFYGDDVRVAAGAGFEDRRIGRGQRAADAIVHLADQLRQRGIHLLVLPVPAKASIYPDRLDPKYDLAKGPNLNIDHAAWMRHLRESGVDVVDMTELFWAQRLGAGGLIYHPTDTHWTFHGMNMAADKVAEQLRPVLGGVPHAPPFRTRMVPQDHMGDLLTRDDIGRPFDPPDIHDHRLQVYDDNGAVIPGDDAPVLIIGDSNAASFVETGSGFSQLLMSKLQVPVQSAAIMAANGNVMRQPLNMQAGLLKNKRAVVFVFTIRQIITNDWQRMGIAE